jgi:hypothetical protein
MDKLIHKFLEDGERAHTIIAVVGLGGGLIVLVVAILNNLLAR